jgi:hypothetical protein
VERGTDPDHEPTDADDRIVEPVEPAQPDPPVDDEDRDPVVQTRRRRRGPAVESAQPVRDRAEDDG